MKFNRSLLYLTIYCLCSFHVTAQDLLIQNAFNRISQSLNGQWSYIVDPYENGFYNYRYKAYDESENPSAAAYFTNSKPKNKTDLIEYDFDKSDSIKVPGDWNSQKEKLFYYEGSLWYKKSFDFTKSAVNNRVFVHFGAVNYQADVYLNGIKLGRHIGGFTPFNFEITDVVREKDNFIIVKVDNKRKKEAVPTLNTDWWNYGGITRDVKIIETPLNFVRDYIIQLDPADKNKIKGYIKLSGGNISSKRITLSIEELKFRQEFITDGNGYSVLEADIENFEYWSPDNPKLYSIIINTDEEEIKDQIGFRIISTEGKHVLLNNEKIFLKGISIHEENPLRGGRAYSYDDAKQLLSWAKELNCNFVRLAHYPHNEYMLRLADRIGILVWEEIPVYWTIEWEKPDTYKNAENQLMQVISRDKNRASVIIWSMANETPVSAPRNNFLKNLAEKARSLDPTRLISAALELSRSADNPDIRSIEDPFSEYVDILSFNLYVGWYEGLPDKCGKIIWNISQNKPVFVSEFGAGAKYGNRGDKMTRWTEEYQEFVYEENLKMLVKIIQLSGLSPWILADFRSPRRPLPIIQDGWNRKGLISNSGEKKKAFFILEKFYESNIKVSE